VVRRASPPGSVGASGGEAPGAPARMSPIDAFAVGAKARQSVRLESSWDGSGTLVTLRLGSRHSAN
jgi:hypothetical protein